MNMNRVGIKRFLVPPNTTSNDRERGRRKPLVMPQVHHKTGPYSHPYIQRILGIIGEGVTLIAS
jgi:hypothetical protein